MDLFCAVASFLCGLQLQASVGSTYAIAPPGGTWWEPGQPHHWHLNSFYWDAGLGGRLPDLWGLESRWSVSYADLGVQSLHAIACGAAEINPCPPLPRAEWNATQHPHGIWAAWEPMLWQPFGIFAQLGGGYFNDRFVVTMPDLAYPCQGSGLAAIQKYGICHLGPSYAGSNVGYHPGYIAGLGLRIGTHLDAIVSNRFIDTPNNNRGNGKIDPATGQFDWTGQYTNLSKSAWTFVLRGRL